MKQIVVLTWCDYPGCAEKERTAQEKQKFVHGQEVGNVDFWFNAFGGRKTKPVKVVMCAEHREQMKALFSEVAKYDQNEKKGETDDNDA